MKNCFIVGSGKSGNIYIPDNASNLIIAADGGFDTLNLKKITPDMVLGDFDSAKEVPDFPSLTIYPKEKDETDTEIALKKAIELGCKKIFIYGGTGGREDHTLANIQLLGCAAEYGVSAYLIYENMLATVIKNSCIYFDEDEVGYISVFSYSDISTDICIDGLKYCVKNTKLDNNTPLGVSNEFIGKKAKISVKNGKLMITWQTNIKKAIDKLIKT